MARQCLFELRIDADVVVGAEQQSRGEVVDLARSVEDGRDQRESRRAVVLPRP
jgi:hypothetical protein